MYLIWSFCLCLTPELLGGFQLHKYQSLKWKFEFTGPSLFKKITGPNKVWLVLGRRTCALSGPNKVWLVLGLRTGALSGPNKVWLVLGWRTDALSGPSKVWLVLGWRTGALSGLNKVWLVLGRNYLFSMNLSHSLRKICCHHLMFAITV